MCPGIVVINAYDFDAELLEDNSFVEVMALSYI